MNIKKKKLIWIISGLIIIAVITAIIVSLRSFPLKLGSKGKNVQIWRSILVCKCYEIRGADLIITDNKPSEFTSKVVELTQEYYGTKEVSYKLFNQEQKRFNI